MHSLNVIHLTLAQFEKSSHKLPNYSMVNYDLLYKQIRQIDENYSFSITSWLIILILVLGTVVIDMGIAAYC